MKFRCEWFSVLRWYLFQIIQLKNIRKQLRSESGRFLFRSVISFIVQMLEWTNKYHFYDNVDTWPLEPRFYESTIITIWSNDSFLNHVMIVWFLNKKIQVELLPDKKE